MSEEGVVITILDNGPPATHVDLLFLGDGYTAAESDKFHADSRRLAGELFEEEPFKSRKGDFNVRGVDSPHPLSSATWMSSRSSRHSWATNMA